MISKRLTQIILVCLLGLLGLFPARPAQAIVVNTVGNDGVTVAQLTAALQGAGVTISNLAITNNGCANRNNAVGLFTQGTTGGAGPVLGDVSGVVLGTGQLKGTNALVSPNDVANWNGGYVCAAATSDADMRILEPNTSSGEYVAIEFDIVPTYSTMIIPFQFGSDEFPEYVCSAYNDVAGIFVSGPGITGPYSNNAQNYAKTPGGDLTSINWVNTGLVGSQGNAGNCGSLTNTAYYTDNSNGNTTGGNATVATTNTNLELDGWTNYLYQPISVTPGQTYHVKAAVADAGDRVYDSAIFFHLIFSTSGTVGFDYGDAPDTYRTLTASGGPRHAINPNIYLGTTPPDSEVTGQPTATALGDDNNGTDDEDGVSSFSPLDVTATSYSVTVRAYNNTGAAANLIGWIDFNRNGTFDSGEGRSLAVANGTNGNVTLTWNGLSGLVGGTTYARFRLTTDPSITTATPGGTANDGEVEDYALEITAYDFSVTKTSPNTSYLLWDTISYSVVVKNNGPTSGTVNNVGVVDTIPAELTGVTWTCTGAGGATCGSASGSGNALNTTANLPLNGTATYAISGILSSLPGSGILSNTASVTAPAGYTDSNAANNSATVAISAGGSTPGTGNKPLYLYDAASTPARKLSRTPPTGAPAYVEITRGANQLWTESPALQLPDTISNVVSPGGIPVLLNIAADNNTRTFTAGLYCSSAPGTILTSATATATGGATITAYNLTIPFTGPIPSMTCANPAAWVLRIDHTGTASATRYIRIYPINGTNISNVSLPSQNVININNSDITFYSATYPGGSALASLNAGQTVYIRATVSDPFGSYDINGATLTLRDSAGLVKVNGLAMTQVQDSGAATKIYEYLYTVPATGPSGNWSAMVLAKEGTETPGVSDNAQASIPVVIPLPVMTISKSADKLTASPGEVVTYVVNYHNTGVGAAYNVVVVDTVPQFTTYVPNSMRMGNAASTYATATPLTDAVDADAGKFVGGTATFSFGPVPADDGVANSGPDEGKVYLQLQIN